MEIRARSEMFVKHEYKVVCECGFSKINNDSGVIDACKLVKISHCQRCCPECAPGTVIQILFDAHGERIYA